MKKYFLLATTALLLGTSNVLAEGGALEVEVNVSATVKAATTFVKESDMNFGTMYVDPEQHVSGTYLASFSCTSTVYLTDAVVHHNGDDEPGIVTVIKEKGYSGYTRIDGIDEDGTLALGDGLEVRNMYINDCIPKSVDETTSTRLFLIGDLYLTQDGYTGTGEGVVYVSYEYE